MAGHASCDLNVRQDSELLYKQSQVGIMWLKTDGSFLHQRSLLIFYLQLTDAHETRKFHREVPW